MHNLLHVRSFLDHNRPYLRPANYVRGTRTGHSTGAFAYMGEEIPCDELEENLVRHLRRWAPYVGRFGLIILELHTLAAATYRGKFGEDARGGVRRNARIFGSVSRGTAGVFKLRPRSRIANRSALPVPVSRLGTRHGQHQFLHRRGPIELIPLVHEKRSNGRRVWSSAGATKACGRRTLVLDSSLRARIF